MSPSEGSRVESNTSKPTHSKEEGDEYSESEKNYLPKSPRFWLIILAVYASIFLVALDRMIIFPAIPAITDEFHSIEDIGWYGSAYMLTAAIFNPLSGRIYKIYPVKWAFLASILVFEAGSALCGAAPTSIAFIIGRAIAGTGAAGIFCGGIMVIVPLVPLRKRPIFTSFFGIAFGVSSVLGPLVGGSFTDSRHLTWRWCFYINLPIGGFTMIAIFLFLHLDSQPREHKGVWNQIKSLDPLGLLFLAPSMICLILALQWGGTTDTWHSPRIIGLLVTFSVTFIAFLVTQALLPETAMAPVRVVLDRSVGATLLYMFLLSGAMTATLYYLTIWFQAAQDQSALQSGIRTIPLVLSLVVMGIITAMFTQKVGYYVPALLLSPFLSAVATGLLSTLVPGSGRSKWIGYQVLYGLGIGCGFQTTHLVPQTVLSRADVPLGMALMFFMQQLGGSVFVSVAQNIFAKDLVKGLSGISGLDAQSIVNSGAIALRNMVPAKNLTAVINIYSHALTRTFILAAALSACTIVGAVMVRWKSIKGKKGEGAKRGSDEKGEAKKEEA